MQHAYLTETALNDLVYKIDGSLVHDYCVFFEETLDNTSFESMDDAASDRGVCSTINRWIDFVLRLSSVFVDTLGVRVHNAYECAK
jgi:hypothetical protein